jgi:hypothetical protein
MSRGEVVLKAGHYVGAAEVGILATVGATAVKVRGQMCACMAACAPRMRGWREWTETRTGECMEARNAAC